MKYHQITVSMAKDIAFSLGADLDDEEAGIFADGYNVAMHKVNKNASTELPNDANLSTSSQAAPDDSGLLPCPFCGSPAEHYPDGDMEGYIIMCGNKNGDCNLQAFGFTTPEEAEKAWNTRAALLQGSQPVSQTYNLPELIEGMEVSIDVSTCDADAGNRYFGTVTEVSELDSAKNGYILLVQDAEPNFDVNGNSPVIPEDLRRAAMLQANQRDLSQPVDPQVADYEKTMLQAGWVMVPKTVTPEISLAINKVGQHCTCGNCSQRLWDMLLAAAPEPDQN